MMKALHTLLIFLASNGEEAKAKLLKITDRESFKILKHLSHNI